MSQATQAFGLKRHFPVQRVVALSGLLALLATAAVVLVLSIDGASTQHAGQPVQSSTAQTQWNGRPIDSPYVRNGYVGSPTTVSPDESHIAAAIGSRGYSMKADDRAETRRWSEYQAKVRSMTSAERATAFGGHR